MTIKITVWVLLWEGRVEAGYADEEDAKEHLRNLHAAADPKHLIYPVDVDITEVSRLFGGMK